MCKKAVKDKVFKTKPLINKECSKDTIEDVFGVTSDTRGRMNILWLFKKHVNVCQHMILGQVNDRKSLMKLHFV